MARGKKHDEEVLKENKQQVNSEDIKEKTVSEKEDENKIKEEEQAINEEIEQLNNRLLRLQADFLNYKTRTEKEKIATYGNAISDFILDLLPVVDNLERALCADNADANPFKEGVQMVYSQFMGILSKKGLKEVDSLHKPFDHNVHYGVGFEESEEYDDGIIIDVLQKGYTVNDKLIRPSMVRICKR